jgi:DNA-binding NarL/FixJ family response regulator
MSVRYLIVGWEAQSRDWVKHHVSAAYPEASLRTMTITDFERNRSAITRRDYDIVVLCAAFGSKPDERRSEGMDTLKRMMHQAGFPTVVVVADGGSEFTAVRALRHGALDYLPRRHLSGERLLETLAKTVRFVQQKQKRADDSQPVADTRTSRATPVAAALPETVLSEPAIEPASEVRVRVELEASLPGRTDLTESFTANAKKPAAAEALNAPEMAALLDVSYPNLVVKAPPKEDPIVVAAASDDEREAPRPDAEASRPDAAANSDSAVRASIVERAPVAVSKPRSSKSRALLPAARSDSLPQVPGYTVLQRIAESDHAHVLLARQGKRRDNIALKIGKIARGTATGARDAASASLEREYETLSTLSHRSVVQIYDFGSHEGFDYLAMEYFPCGDLQRRLQNPVSSDEVVDYVRQIARALEFVHRLGLVHGDLKPQNVMLRSDNSIALIDFGLASDQKRDAGDDTPGLVCGSPYYMSPEQTNGKRLDGRSDLYSLGVMLYEMLIGKRPYVAKTIPEIIEMHRNSPPPTLPAEHATFQTLIDRLLAKEPEQRFHDATQLLLALNSFGSARAGKTAEFARA